MKLDDAKAALECAASQLTESSRKLGNKLMFFASVAYINDEGNVSIECVANISDDAAMVLLEKIIERKKSGNVPVTRMSTTRN